MIEQIIHVGANDGMEAAEYARGNRRVFWIEADPIVFQVLEANIERYRDQSAVNALITDVDGKQYHFHRASNCGNSSSILSFDRHRDIWPDVRPIETITLTSTTLDRLLASHDLDAGGAMLVIDVQGAEAMVLRGATETLAVCKYVVVEVADFSAYRGCATEREIVASLHGYDEVRRKRTMHAPGIGSYYNIGYLNRRAAA